MDIPPTIDLVLRINPETMEELQETLASVPNGANRAMAAAINRTLGTGITRIKRRLAGILNLPSNTILHTMRTERATPQNLEGHIVFSRKAMSLLDFDATGGGKNDTGIDVMVFKGKAEHHDHWFISNTKRGQQFVFDRAKGGGGSSGRVPRGPTKGKFGPTVVGVVANHPGTLDDINDQDLSPILKKNLESQVDRLLERRKGPA